MAMTRRDFLRHGAGAFTVGLAGPAVLADLARAQGSGRRALVVCFFAGGNDALSTLVPYTDPYYYSRRPSIAVAAGDALQVGSDSSGVSLGLHPGLPALRAIFNEGRLAIVQRTGYANSTRSHFLGTDVWGSANPASPQSHGWLGRYLDTLPQPVDPLAAWDAVREIPRALTSDHVPVPAIPSASGYVFSAVNGGAEAARERVFAERLASRDASDRPHLAFVNAGIDAAMNTLDKVALVAKYAPAAVYPSTPTGTTLKTVAGALVKGVGTRVFWVQLGGFDTHAAQAATYPRLMTEFNDAVVAFYADLRAQGLWGDVLLMTFSEFGRRAYENGSAGTDHGAAGLMFAAGGAVRGGLYGTAASLNPAPDNPALENSGGDVGYETDFRSVYARVIDHWLGGDSVSILQGDFRRPGLAFV
ncbi:MAG TPA: DUF1501 domain-containing protein [Vicinamibacterales bacterium]|nr:DUF1501 domain-containing protein [Vicinamibacterales bacterium]